MSLPINGDTITRVGAQVSVATMSGGWMADVMAWQWGTISFIVGTLMALATFAWNAYFKRKEYLLKEREFQEKLKHKFFEYTKDE